MQLAKHKCSKEASLYVKQIDISSVTHQEWKSPLTWIDKYTHNG